MPKKVTGKLDLRTSGLSRERVWELLGEWSLGGLVRYEQMQEPVYPTTSTISSAQTFIDVVQEAIASVLGSCISEKLETAEEHTTKKQTRPFLLKTIRKKKGATSNATETSSTSTSITRVSVFPGGTDARFVRQILGCPVIGITPFRTTPILLHDVDECLSVDTYLESISAYTAIIDKLVNQ